MRAAVIPAYNEEKTVKETIERTKKFVEHIVVIDDGSTDGTFSEAKKTGVTVIKHERNRGKTAALKTGFAHIGDSDTVIIMDADLQHLPEEIPLLLDAIENGCDLCIGSRLLSDSNHMPSFNKISNRVTSLVLSIMAGQKITDPQSGFRALKRETLDNLELVADRYAVEHIMILEAARKGFKIKEIPVSCIYGGETSHIRPAKDAANVIYNILRFMVSR